MSVLAGAWLANMEKRLPRLSQKSTSRRESPPSEAWESWSVLRSTNQIDPFRRGEARRGEADAIIDHRSSIIDQLYRLTSGLQKIFAALFEFSFYTEMRPGEAMALRWSEVDTRKRTAKVCRIRIYGKIQERTKTKKSREVLLNVQALHALDTARPLTAARSDDVFAPDGRGLTSELNIRSGTGPKRYWLSALRRLGIRQRRMYDTRHMYTTLCLMSGMNPAFIAAQSQ